MKFRIFIFFTFLVLANTQIFAQKTTFILLRHAEKDSSVTADKRNPALSEAGKKRAESLHKIIEKYKPQEIFSTTYVRTRATVTPLAFSLFPPFRLQIQFYDATEQEKFAEELLQTKSKCVVVVGHSNTVPALANLLIKDNKYKDLADTEYNKIFILEINRKKNRTKSTIIEY
ncbi:MAG: histidine phosphatase family protein [Pyrinomonadaceae bacterium]|jgi:phosphohistidine phosphatase SixA|nr:histidine phosphatase family protein [Pyrinomonadaceae bacterium]